MSSKVWRERKRISQLDNATLQNKARFRRREYAKVEKQLKIRGLTFKEND